MSEVLRALIEAVLAFDDPAFPPLSVEAVERQVLAHFPMASLAPMLEAFAAGYQPAHGAAFADAPLPARRAYLRLWASSELEARRRLYTTLKAVVLIPAYGLPDLRRAIGDPGADG